MKKRFFCWIVLTVMITALLPMSDIFADTAETLLSFHFDDADDQALFSSGLIRGSVTFGEGDGTFGINGGYAKNGNSHTLYPLQTPLVRSENSGVYLEVEYDMMPLTATGSNESLGTVTIVEGTGNAGDAYVHGGGIQFYKKEPTNENSGLWTAFWNPGVHVGETPYEFGEWYRCKTVIQLNKDGAMTNAGVVDMYINGEKLATGKIYSSAFAAAENIRLYASSTTYGIDNLTVRKYTEANKPIEKGVLVKKLRDFEKKYKNYKETPDAKKYFDQAAAVYYNENATEAEITAAYDCLEQAAAAIFPGTKVVESDMEDGQNDFFTLSGSADAVNETSTAYGTGRVLSLSLPEGAAASRSFSPAVTLGTSSAENYFIIDLDVNAATDIMVSLTENTAVTIPGSGEWSRMRILVDRAAKTYQIYQNGIEIGSDSLGNATEISGISLTSAAGGMAQLDNISVFTAETSDAVVDKGAMLKEMRIAKAAGFGSKETAIMDAAFVSAERIFQNPAADAAEVSASAKKLAFLNLNLSATNDDAFQEIFVPGRGVDAENVVLQFNLHNGAQEGDISYDELFFNGASENDFEDVVFSDHNGELPSQVISSGNYDFISDSQIPKNVLVLTLADGTLVSQKNGIVLSKDNAKTWTKVGIHSAARLAYVDKQDNIYYTLKGSEVTEDEPIGLYQIRADENYETAHCVIDLSDLLGQVDSEGKTVSNDTDIIFHAIAEDDDGYIYAGRYCEPWVGSCLYVSRPGGQEFRVVDYRPDKQHTHFISVNHYVYPNEVYVSYDDSSNSPVCQITTDKGGYEEIRRLEEETGTTDFMTPLKATWENAEGTDGRWGKIVPSNDIAKRILAYSKKHFTQVPNPFRNTDYFGHFGVIDQSKIDENGYTDWSNLYAIGMGEANILGGPSVYRTTNPMEPEAYYPVIETTQGARRAIAPVPGIIIAGGLAGGAAQSPQMWISYDDGDTWSCAYTESFAISTAAGNGVGRTYSSQTAKVPVNFQGTAEAVNENQVILCGFGNYTPVRAKFGGDNYYGYSYCQVPYLPAEGMKLFVSIDKNQQITDYTYEAWKGDMAIRGVKSQPGEGDALRFTTEPEERGEIAVYSFDIDTDSDTQIYADVLATDNKKDETILSLAVDTLSGNIYNDADDTVLVSGSDIIKDGHFNVRIMVDYKKHTAGFFINGTPVAENLPVSASYCLPKELVLGIGDTEGGAYPAEVYYSNVSYGFGSSAAWIAKDLVMTSEGNPTDRITKGTVIESVTMEEGMTPGGTPVLMAALYNEDGVLSQVCTQTVSDSGSYDLNLISTEDNMTLRFYLFWDTESLMPVYLEKLF